MTTRNRTQLKSVFVKDAIPTGDNYADLIDSSLNQSEDGIFTSPSDSLAIVAAGDSKRVLRLFGAPPPADPDWQISLSPPQTAANPQSSRVGLGVSDGAGNLRLFIDAATGNLGVGTNAPAAPLDVRVPGAVPDSDRLLVDATTAWDGTDKHVTLAAANTGQLNLHNPHVPWLASESRASIRFGRSGGVAGGGFWDVGTRAGNTFSISLNGAADPKLSILDNGTVILHGDAQISGELTVPTANIGKLLTNSLTTATINASSNITSVRATIAGITCTAIEGRHVKAENLEASQLIVAPAASIEKIACRSVRAATSLSASYVNADLGATVTGDLTATTLNATGNLVSPRASIDAIASSSINVSSQLTAMVVTAKKGVIVSEGLLTAPHAVLGLRPRKALFFHNPLTSYPRLPPINTSFAGGFTIQAWVYLYSFDHFARVIDLGNGPSLDNIMFYIGADGRLGGNVFVLGGAPLGDIFSDPGVLTLRRWTHVAMSVATDGTIKLYRDGVEVRSARTQVPRNVVRGSNYLGRSNWANDPLLHGHLADVSIWQGARTPTTGPLVGNEPGLLALWHLSQDLQDSATTPVIGHGTYANGDLAPIFGTAHESSQETAVHAQAWIPLQPYNPGWAPYGQGWGPPSYFKDSHGIVRLSGLVSFTNANSNVSGPPFNMLLPPGYRPQFNTLCSTACSSASGFGRVDVFPNGQIHVTNGHGTWTSLDGIAFRAFA